MTPIRSALDRLVPHGQEVFAERIWGLAPLHLTSAERGGDTFDDLFGLAAADELLAQRGLRVPFLRMAEQGRVLPESAFTSGGGVGATVPDQVDPDKVRRLFADGASIVLQALHRTWAPVEDFAGRLAADLGHPVQVNSYITPVAHQGFEPHYDVHDVFVLQVHGTKQWTLHPPVLAQPHRDEPWGNRRHQVHAAAAADPLAEVRLHPGDLLYLPRGFLHSARAGDGTSIHLTVGIHAWTGLHLARAVLAAAAEAVRDLPEVRRALAVGIDLADPEAMRPQVERFRETLAGVIGTLDADTVLQGLSRQAAAAQRPAPLAPLSQLEAAEALTAHDCVRLRRHLQLRLTSQGPERRATSRAGTVRLEAAEADALTQLLDGTERKVGAIPGATVQAVAALVRTGLVEVLR